MNENFRPRTKEAAKIIKAVRKRKGAVRPTKKGHLLVTGPDGRSTVIGSHFGDPRSFRNATNRIRNHIGLDLGVNP